MTISSELQERVSVCTGGRETERERVRETQKGGDRKGENPGRPPSSQTFSLHWPRPGGPIHASMSSLSNLGLTVCV